MPLRSPKMNRFIFGFQRRVWWPKWTPASSNCLMVTTATLVLPSVGLVIRRACASQEVTTVGGPGGVSVGTRSRDRQISLLQDRAGSSLDRFAFGQEHPAAQLEDGLG